MNSLERIKVMMFYDEKKTLNENLLILELNEGEKNSNIKLISPEKNVYLINGRTYKWTIVNKKQTGNLKILKVDILPPQDNYPSKWNCADYPTCSKPSVYVSSFTKEEIKPNWQGSINITVGWGADAPQEKDRALERNFNFKLLITTTEGQVTTLLRSGTFQVEDVYAKKQRETLEKVQERKTPNLGIPTPEGFSPFSYEEFLQELYDILSNKTFTSAGANCNYKTYYDKYFSKNRTLTRKYPLPGGVNTSEDVDSCNRALKNLVAKYFNKKFPKGITPEDKELFDTEFKNANTELDKFKRENMVQRMREPFDKYFDSTRLSAEKQKKYKELVSKVEGIKSEFGYDDRNWFDKWWEEYGLWVQIGVGVITLIATMGAASPGVISYIAGIVGTEATAVRAALLGAERLSILADFYMNASVGTYQLAKGDTKEAILSFFFAALPKVHGLYSKIGQIFGKPSVETTRALANKISQVTLRTKDDVNAFISILSPEEAKLFRSAMKMSKNDYEKVFELIKKDMEKTLNVSTGTKVAKGTGKFVGTAALDFGLIHTSQELYVKSVDFINKYCKNCITTEEEKRMAKTYLDSLTPIQFKNLRDFLDIATKNEPSVVKQAEIISAGISGKLDNIAEEWGKDKMNKESLKKVDDVLEQLRLEKRKKENPQ